MDTVKVCTVEGCTRRYYGRGLCGMHYQRQWKHGSTDDRPKPGPRSCTVAGCEKPLLARGWCGMHYMRVREHGSLEKAARVYPDRTLRPCGVDGCERSVWSRELCDLHYARQNRSGDVGPAGVTIAPAGDGCLRADGYRILSLPDHPIAVSKGKVLEHRVVLYDAIGPGGHPCHWCGLTVFWEKVWPYDLDGLVVDHFDFDRSNNTLANLFPSCGPCNTRRVPPR